MKTEFQEVSIFTDGGCRGNPGAGAWAAILTNHEQRRTLAGVAELTTNNQMELTAAIRALDALQKPCQIRLVSDSKYMIQGITDWIKGWKRRNWRTADKKPVKNQELWKALDQACSKHEVKWEWTRGHSGHPENEDCDFLVNLLMDRLESEEAPETIIIDERSTL